MAEYNTPIFLDSGNASFTFQAGDEAKFDGGGDAFLFWQGENGGAPNTVTIDNLGTITGSFDDSLTLVGDELPTGQLTFTNHEGAKVENQIDVRDLQSGGTVVIDNSGLFDTNEDHAMRLATDGGAVTLTNETTGVITTETAGEDVIKDGSNSTIDNHGKIIAAADVLDADGNPDDDLSGADAIDFGDGTNNVVHNFAGGIIEGAKHGITGDIGITVVNEVGATISGRNGSGLNFDNGPVEDESALGGNDSDTVAQLRETMLIVTNFGNILGESRTYADSDGDAIDADGMVRVKNFGFIGGMGANGEHNDGTNHAEGIAAGGGRIINREDGMIFSVETAIQIDDSSEGNAFARSTIINTGTIQSNTGLAINIVDTFADRLTNAGTIIGDINMGGGNDDVKLRGASHIKGDINLGDGDDSLLARGNNDIVVDGGAGNDTIKGGLGDDSITGGDGNDVIYGRGGTDTLVGGADADTFHFAFGDTGHGRKTADTIADFKTADGDIVDLSAIDARTDKDGDQAFHFIGDKAFDHKAGELRFDHQGQDTYIYGDIDGNGKADFMIHLTGTVDLTKEAFTL